MSLNHERVQPILRVDGLNVELKIRNKQKKLVENVSFEVEPGQCLGILGESGSGKSMTVKAILGLLDRQFRIEGRHGLRERIYAGQDGMNCGGCVGRR